MPERIAPPNEQMVDWIRQFIDTHGYCPSNREFAEGIGLQVSAANYQLGRLRRAGLVDFVPSTPRTLRPA